MKYFHGKLWTDMNIGNRELAREAELQWDILANEYSEYFKIIKDKLPKGFLRTYLKTHGFHDYVFDNINLSNTEKKKSVIEFIVSHGDEKYKIILMGVEKFSINVSSTENWIFGKLAWGYDEFELIGDNLWVIRILCDFDCEMEVLFKRIAISNLQ